MTELEQYTAVAAEIRAAFYAYEAALTQNRLQEINSFFFSSDKTARFGAAENEHQYGFAAITQARLRRGSVSNPKRKLVKVHVCALTADVGVAHAEYLPEGVDAIGRQSQTWLRSDDGWKIISAHVSFGRKLANGTAPDTPERSGGKPMMART